MTSSAGTTGSAGATAGGATAVTLTTPLAEVGPSLAVTAAVPTPTSEISPAGSTTATEGFDELKSKYRGAAMTVRSLPPTSKVTRVPPTDSLSPISLKTLCAGMAGRGLTIVPSFSNCTSSK